MFVAEKAAVFQQQGIGGKVVPQLLDQFLFAVVLAADGQGHFNVRAQFHQADFADLREGAVTTATTAAAKVRVVGRRVGHVQNRAIDTHQAQAMIEAAWRLRGGQRTDHRVKDASDRFYSQALSGLAQIAPRGCFVAGRIRRACLKT